MEEAADSSLPQRAEFTAGELDKYLDRLRARAVEDLGAAKRNAVSIYPEDFQAFQVRLDTELDLSASRPSLSTLTFDPYQVYVESYHQAVARRLKVVTDNQLEITDIYSLLDWLYNIYSRYGPAGSGETRNLHTASNRTGSPDHMTGSPEQLD